MAHAWATGRWVKGAFLGAGDDQDFSPAYSVNGSKKIVCSGDA